MSQTSAVPAATQPRQTVLAMAVKGLNRAGAWQSRAGQHIGGGLGAFGLAVVAVGSFAAGVVWLDHCLASGADLLAQGARQNAAFLQEASALAQTVDGLNLAYRETPPKDTPGLASKEGWPKGHSVTVNERGQEVALPAEITVIQSSSGHTDFSMRASSVSSCTKLATMSLARELDAHLSLIQVGDDRVGPPFAWPLTPYQANLVCNMSGEHDVGRYSDDTGHDVKMTFQFAR